MATQNFINECKNMANANRLGRFELQMYDRFEKEFKGNTLQDGTPTPDTPVEIQSVTGLQKIIIQDGILPNEYVQVDYIQSSETQWIDTELYPTENMQIETKIEVAYTNQDTPVFGCFLNTIGSSSLGDYFHLTPYANKWYYGTNGSEGNFGTYSNAIGTQYDIVFNNENNQIIVNDNIEDVTRPFSGATNSTLAISKRGTTSNNRFGRFKYFNFKIFDKSTNKYIRNFIPCYRKSDNEIGLYDIVEGKFYTNQGTGTFTYGEILGTTYEVNLGKNLLNNTATSQTINGITYTINEDKSITANGTATAHSVLNIYNTSLVLQPGTYMFSGCPKNGSWGTYSMGYGTYNDSGNGAIINTNEVFSGVPYIRIASGTTVNNLVFKPMIEKGSQVTSYSPYFTPIELNKIGDYQDRIYKDNGKWYVEHKIKKTVITNDNKTMFINFNEGYGTKRIRISKTDLGWESSWENHVMLVNLYKEATTVNEFVSGRFTGALGQGSFHFFNDNFTDLETARNMMVGTIMYCVLATPTYTEITNTELINQLESIELLKGTNNITITSEDLPIIFDYSFWNGDTEVDEDDRFLEVNQSNYLTSIELKDSCCVNNNILGTTYTKSAEVELLDLPVGTKLESQIITPEIGVKYNDDTTEYETFDDYVIESLNDEQTASNTKFTAMNGGTLLDKEYECSLSFENGQTHTINEFYQDACSQIGLTPTDNIFDNSELIMTGNPFTNKETIRTVISEVEKTSCSIARIDWKNKTISLTWLSDQINYEFNTSDYSTLEGSLTQYGPLNVIIIANSQLNGENVVMTDQESVAEYGEHQIIIDSPYFLYTEELRTQAIQAIYNKLDGLKYYDLKLTTPYGKPFLNIGDKIRINTNENQVLDTYVLSHTFKFDGTFSSVIESPALTQEEQTIKNEFKGNSVREKLRRTELMVDKTTGDITAITDRVTTVENEFGDVYSKEEVNTLVQNSATGITNTFVNSGGNNLLRNTGLWFEDRSEIEYMYPRTTGLYPSDELFMSADPHWEYWRGNAKKVKEDKAANMSGILLQTGYLEQQQQVRNGTYTLSFKYRKLIELATVNVQINDRYIDLTNIEDTEIIEVGEITSQNISIKIFSDTDDSCIIYDLMLNAGSEKAEYSQHQNETTTDTVNISKGITIQSSDTNTTFKANSDGIRVYNSRDMDTPITEYTDTGMDTNRIKVKEEAEIIQVLWKNVGNNTWISRL